MHTIRQILQPLVQAVRLGLQLVISLALVVLYFSIFTLMAFLLLPRRVRRRYRNASFTNGDQPVLEYSQHSCTLADLQQPF